MILVLFRILALSIEKKFKGHVNFKLIENKLCT